MAEIEKVIQQTPLLSRLLELWQLMRLLVGHYEAKKRRLNSPVLLLKLMTHLEREVRMLDSNRCESYRCAYGCCLCFQPLCSSFLFRLQALCRHGAEPSAGSAWFP
jgi:hypothetical protein